MALSGEAFEEPNWRSEGMGRKVSLVFEELEIPHSYSDACFPQLSGAASVTAYCPEHGLNGGPQNW